MNGIAVIDKPTGMTSFAVVASMKRLSRERRVGHAGTLDPLASGVLPVCFGQATRVIEYLMESPKSYRAEVELGVTTDTGDAAGNVIERRDPSSVSHDTLVTTLERFCGRIEQIPPMFSALKHRGTPLYRLARAGLSVERQSRVAEVYGIELVAWDPPVATIEISCSRGTYVRTLAEDVGKCLGCGASLQNLRRLSYGPFDVHHSVTLSLLEEAFHQGSEGVFIHPLDVVLGHWPSVVADAELAGDIVHGRPVPAGRIQPVIESAALAGSKNRLRAYTLDGRFFGVLRFNPVKNEWQPEKVFPD